MADWLAAYTIIELKISRKFFGICRRLAEKMTDALPDRCSTQFIFVGLGRLVFPADGGDGYACDKLRDAFCSAPTLSYLLQTARSVRFSEWIREPRKLRGKRGKAHEVPPIVHWILARGNAKGAWVEELMAASTMAAVADVIGNALLTRRPSSPEVNDALSPPMLSAELMAFNQGRALRAWCGTWVIVRPSTRCRASIELLHILDNDGGGGAAALCLNDMGALFTGHFVQAQAPVAYGMFGRKKDEVDSFNMRSIFLSVGADGPSDVATGYMIGKKDNSDSKLACAPLLLVRFASNAGRDIKDGMALIDRGKEKVGLRDVAEHGVFEYFDRARKWAGDDDDKGGGRRSGRKGAAKAGMDCPLAASFLPDHEAMLDILGQMGFEGGGTLAAELLDLPKARLFRQKSET